MKSISRHIQAIAVFALAQFALTPAQAQADWPNRPVRVLIPSSPGGPSDLVIRIIAEKFQTEFKQPLVVDFRPGAGGKIAMRLTAKAPADGYTFVVGNPGPVAVVGHTETDVGYNTKTDFDAVATLMSVPIKLVVRSDVPAKNVVELVALMKRNPKAIAFGSSGEGQSPHMAAELFRRQAGADFLIVPYKGAPPAMNDLLGGAVQAIFDTTTALPFVKEGRLRVLATGSAKRSPLLPDVPTMAESGFSGFEISSWYVLLAPTGTPQAITEKMNRLVRSTLELPEVVEQLAKNNAEGIPTTVARSKQFVDFQIENWGSVVAKIKGASPAAKATK